MPFVKSLQKGSTTLGTTQDVLDIDITAINAAKAIITIKVRCLSTNQRDMAQFGNYGVVPRMLDNDTLRLERWYLTAQSIVVSWFVYELDDSVEVENGIVQFDANPTDVDLTIGNSDNSFSICHLYSRYNSWSGDFDDQVIYHAVFNPGSGPDLRIRGNLVLPLGTAIHRVYWQVVRSTAIDVTQLTINNIPNILNTNSYDLPAAVDLDNSFLIWSCQHQDGAIPNPNNQHLKMAYMLDNDTISTTAYAGFAAPFSRCYVIELQPGNITVIDRGLTLWDGETVNIDVTSKDAERNITNIGGSYNCWSGANSTNDDFKDIGTTSIKVDIDTFQLQRGDQDVNPVQAFTTWEDIEFLVGEGGIPIVNFGLTMNKLTDGRLANA